MLKERPQTLLHQQPSNSYEYEVKIPCRIVNLCTKGDNGNGLDMTLSLVLADEKKSSVIVSVRVRTSKFLIFRVEVA